MDKVDGIYSKVEGAIECVRQSEQEHTRSLLAAVEKVFASFEEKLASLNARLRSQSETMTQLTAQRQPMVTHETQTDARHLADGETQTAPHSPYRQLIENPAARIRTHSENCCQKRKAADQSHYYKNNKMPKQLNHSLTIPRQTRQYIRPRSRSDSRRPMSVNQPASVLRAMHQKRLEERGGIYLPRDGNGDSGDDLESVEYPRETFQNRSNSISNRSNLDCIFEDFEPAQHSTPIKTPSSESLSARCDMYQNLRENIFPETSQNISVFVDSSDSDG